MSATPSRRRRATRAVLAGALSLVVLAGCTGVQKDAGSYRDTEEDFLAGCIQTAEADNALDGATAIESPENYCQCAFDAIVDNVKFDRFKEINGALREEGGELPTEITDAFDGCRPAEGASG